jgi:hypothetical protein
VPGETRELDLRLRIDSDEELDELEKALLKARATELAEVRRQGLRYTAGYGDEISREVMSETSRLAQVRFDVLTRLVEALRRERDASD